MRFEINDRVRLKKKCNYMLNSNGLGADIKTLYVIVDVGRLTVRGFNKQNVSINANGNILTFRSEIFKKVSSPGKRLGEV